MQQTALRLEWLSIVNDPIRRTRIVATLGPASNSPEMIRQLIAAGMDGARFNFSHGVPAKQPRGTNFIKLHTVT